VFGLYKTISSKLTYKVKKPEKRDFVDQ